MLIHENDVTISDATTGEIIRELVIDATRTTSPEKPGKEKHPGPKTGVLPMTRLIREGCLDSLHLWS
jgi:hypothetical protein